MKKIMLSGFSIILVFQLLAQPLNDIVKREIITEKSPLNYAPLREADIFWERGIWQVIDVREKQNAPIMYPERPLFEIIKEAALSEDITLYDAENDHFEIPLLKEDLNSILSRTDTIYTIDPLTYEETTQVVSNDIYWEDIKRFRIKEIWFVNSKTAQLEVRIMGIAPMIEVNGENGEFLYEKAMFWAYYPELRAVLAQNEVFNTNQASRITWDDWMEQRRFSATVYKENNVLDRRLKDYLTGVDLLQESEKVKQAIFNFEQDLWSH